jgi:uncharacterized membrane protein
MKELLEYKRAFDMVKKVAIIAISTSILSSTVLGTVFILSYKRVKNRILVLDQQGNINHASESDLNDEQSRQIEAKAHVAKFYKLLYQMDEASYKENMEEASFLAANCFKNIVSEHNNQQLHRKLVVENLYTKCQIDSIFADLNQKKGSIYGTQELVYPAGSITRNMFCKFDLLMYSRSEKNPHGFKIENWQEFDNKTIKTKTNY